MTGPKRPSQKSSAQNRSSPKSSTQKSSGTKSSPSKGGKKPAAKRDLSRRGGAKSDKALSKVGPSRPAGPSKDPRTAQGRGGTKASDARQVARPTASGLGGSGHADTAQPRDRLRQRASPARPKSAGGSSGGPHTGQKASSARTGGPRGAATGVDLNAPAPETIFRDRDNETHTFAESNLKRVAARILESKQKPWRYRPFPFPLFSDKGNEQAFFFDFYVYDNMDMVLKLILVTPRESAEIWDKIGRFKRQYPMYSYELWTPEKLAQLQQPRSRLGF